MHPALRSCHPSQHPSPECGFYAAWRGCGPGSRFWHGPVYESEEEGHGGGSFGVRRPLRFLTHKLGLQDHQVIPMARILDELKTERAQAEVDHRRTLAAFADALAGDPFDAARAAEGGALRVRSAERVRDAVVKAIQQIHAILTPEQRSLLAYLIRSGTLSM